MLVTVEYLQQMGMEACSVGPYLPAANASFTSALGVDLECSSRTEIVRTSGSVLRLSCKPLISIESITQLFCGCCSDGCLVEPCQYNIQSADHGEVVYSCGSWPADMKTDGILRFSGRSGRYSVEYTAGYDDTFQAPEDVKLAIAQEALRLSRLGSGRNLKSIKFGDVTETFESVSFFDSVVSKMKKKYARRGL